MFSSLISKAVAFLGARARLYIEYALIAIIITIGSVSGVLWIEKEHANKKIDALTMEVGTATIINGLQQTSIDNLKEKGKLDDTAIQHLQAYNEKVTYDLASQRTKVRKLEKSDAKVKAYLNQPVPDSIRCLLNDTCPKSDGVEDRDTKTDESIVQSVPAANSR